MKIRNKIVGGILAVAVIGTCAYAACGTNSTPTSEQLVLQPFIPEKDNQNSSVESESQACIGMSLTVSEILYEDYVEYNVSSEAVKAYTLTARYAPSYVTMSAQVDWSVSFVNPASEWAVGKTATDYITVTPETDGALTATVECWEGFSSDILITATLRANNAVKANCLCVWIHNNDEGGENEGGGNSGSSGDDGTGDSSSGSGSSGTQNPDSGNTDSGGSSGNGFGLGGSTDGDDSTVEYIQTSAGDMIVYEGTINEDPTGLSVPDGKRVFAISQVYNEGSLEWDCMECIEGATWRSWYDELCSTKGFIEGVDGNHWAICGQAYDGTPVYICIVDDGVYIAYGSDNTAVTHAAVIVGGGADAVIGFNYYELSGS